jgi:nickel/cobalt transporter (NicO) family protein
LEPAAIVFLAGASATAALHALIPDHWLPFVLMGRSRNWSARKTLTLASAGGALHVCLAVVLGLAAFWIGRGGAEAVARRLGETLEVVSSLCLAIFGIVYGTYSWVRERRHHPPGGATGSPPGKPGGAHHHGHLLEGWFGRDLTGLTLVLVIGVSPCALALPILLATAASLGISGVLLVAAGFGLVTMGTTLVITLVGFLSARRIDFPFLTRYGDLISGILIALVGIFLFGYEVAGH